MFDICMQMSDSDLPILIQTNIIDKILCQRKDLWTEEIPVKSCESLVSYTERNNLELEDLV